MKRITSFGEVLFDIYPDGRKLGGAPFNFIYHIKKITGIGNFISRIGNDSFGDEISRFMRSNHMITEFIQIDNDHPTGAAYANLDERRMPHWKIASNCAYDFIETEERISSLIDSGTDCIYFGTLVQRNAKSRSTLKSLFSKDKRYFCDLNIRQSFYTKEAIEASLKASNVLKLNDDELKLLNSLFINRDLDEVSLAGILSAMFEIDLVCVTLGEKGAIIFSGGQSDHQKLEAEKVVDTVGAGDAYAAILCLGYLDGWKISKINKTALEFAANIVGIQGALPLNDNFYVKFKEELVNA